MRGEINGLARIVMAKNSANGAKLPGDLVAVGYVAGAYGLNGWLRIRPFASDAGALLGAKTWWLGKPESAELVDFHVMQAKMHGGDVVAQMMGMVDRDAAEAMRGTAIHIARSHFPALDDEEFYWVDLIGLSVENIEGESLGVVNDMVDNGAHPVLRVRLESFAEVVDAKDAAELLIPFVKQVVQTVDRPGKKIVVDWQRDY